MTTSSLPTDPPPASSPSAPAFSPRAPWAGPPRSARVLRWAIALLAAALGIGLLATGHVLFGGIVTVMAGLRLALLVTMGRRREQIRATVAARRAARPWPPAPRPPA